jgi:hypothetical protein
VRDENGPGIIYSKGSFCVACGGQTQKTQKTETRGGVCKSGSGGGTGRACVVAARLIQVGTDTLKGVCAEWGVREDKRKCKGIGWSETPERP